MGDMTVDELKDKKLWFLWSAKPGRNGKVTKVPFAANGGATGTDDAHKGTDKLPKGKKPCLSLRELEKHVNTDLDFACEYRGRTDDSL